MEGREWKNRRLAVPVGQMRRNKGPTSGRGNGKKRQNIIQQKRKSIDLGEQWGEMTGLYCVKERGQVNPEFDSLVELKVDMLGRTKDKGCDKK